MAVRYRHTQTNGNLFILFAAVALVLVTIWAMLSRAGEPPAAILLGILLLVAAIVTVFSSLTVEVTDDTLTWSFALGVLRRRVPLADIARAEAVMIPWWFGAGVKLAGGAITYLVKAGPAVAITLKSGGRDLRIGSDDAEALVAALRPRWAGPERRDENPAGS
jgi:hypothetical protein